jgi:hypothetical protein
MNNPPPKKAQLWGMKLKINDEIEFYSLRRTKKHCISEFEASFGQPVTPEFMSCWECVRVKIIEVSND